MNEKKIQTQLSQDSLKYAGLSILAILGLCVFFLVLQSHKLPIQIKPLIYHAKQCLEMSRQDSNAMFALQHAVEGLTHIQVARKLASDGKIQELTLQSPSDLEELFQARISELLAIGPSKTFSTASVIS